MTFADDAVLCKKPEKEVETKLEGWRDELERAMKISWKIRYWCMNKNKDNDKVQLQRIELSEVTNFKHLKLNKNGTSCTFKKSKAFFLYLMSCFYLSTTFEIELILSSWTLDKEIFHTFQFRIFICCKQKRY